MWLKSFLLLSLLSLSKVFLILNQKTWLLKNRTSSSTDWTEQPKEQETTDRPADWDLPSVCVCVCVRLHTHTHTHWGKCSPAAARPPPPAHSTHSKHFSRNASRQMQERRNKRPTAAFLFGCVWNILKSLRKITLGWTDSWKSNSAFLSRST